MGKHKVLMEGLAKLLKESELSNASLIGILEILKIDLAINSGCVRINGKPLVNVD